LYELNDDQLENGIIALGHSIKLVLANGSEVPDGNAEARQNLNSQGVGTIDRLLPDRLLGHNKFVVRADAGGPKAVWTGSTNWATTGLCTQINNGLLVEDESLAAVFADQWERLKKASPPSTNPAAIPRRYVAPTIRRASLRFRVSMSLRGSRRRPIAAIWLSSKDLIQAAKSSIHFLMFTPGNGGLQDRVHQPGK